MEQALNQHPDTFACPQLVGPPVSGRSLLQFVNQPAQLLGRQAHRMLPDLRRQTVFVLHGGVTPAVKRPLRYAKDANND